MTEALQGRFAWYDLVSPAPTASVDFYTRVIGWGSQGWADSPVPYTMWMAGEVPVGGVGPLVAEAAGSGARPYWIGHVSVPDVAQALARLLALGGKQEGEVAVIPSVGQVVPVIDPQGARFELFQPERPAEDPPRGPVPVGHIAWNELMTSDLPAAVEFYCALFGWQKGSAFETPGGPYQILRHDGRDMAGLFAPGKSPTLWCYYARVVSAAAVAAAIPANGGTLAMGPMSTPGGDTIVVGVDPHGVMFGAVEFAKP
jgi:predicted enzyme related to lactoylglutathione lyase